MQHSRVRSKHPGPPWVLYIYGSELHWQESNKDMEITCYTNSSQRRNETRRTVLEGNLLGWKPLDAPTDDWSSLGRVYKAKRESSVCSAFFWDLLVAVRTGWVWFAAVGDGMESAALARSSRNLSKSERNKFTWMKHGKAEGQHYILYKSKTFIYIPRYWDRGVGGTIDI